MVEEKLKDIHLDPAANAGDTNVTNGAAPAPAEGGGGGGGGGMTMFQRDRALAACVLDCDFIYEALDRVSSDGDAGRCNATPCPHPPI